jgi:[ribosomal protein S5]-alanine N-acetyltransferase
VIVRSPLPSDCDAYDEAMRSSRRLHHPWLSQSPPGAFDRLLALVGNERFEPLLVVRRQDGALVGFFNISEIVRGRLQGAFLGYGGVAAYAGQGYMSEGLQLVLRHAFTELKLHRIEANIQPANARSIALVQRAGFVREGFSERYLKIGGRWRDHERWAITAELWRACGRRGAERSDQR